MVVSEIIETIFPHITIEVYFDIMVPKCMITSQGGLYTLFINEQYRKAFLLISISYDISFPKTVPVLHRRRRRRKPPWKFDLIGTSVCL